MACCIFSVYFLDVFSVYRYYSTKLYILLAQLQATRVVTEYRIGTCAVNTQIIIPLSALLELLTPRASGGTQGTSPCVASLSCFLFAPLILPTIPVP